MNWTKANAWCLTSHPPGWTVTKASAPTGWAYQAWHCKEHLLTASGPDALALCKAACERSAG